MKTLEETDTYIHMKAFYETARKFSAGDYTRESLSDLLALLSCFSNILENELKGIEIVGPALSHLFVSKFGINDFKDAKEASLRHAKVFHSPNNMTKAFLN